MKLDYPILSDPEKKVARAYGVVGPARPVPQRWTFYIGPDRKILAIDKAVRTAFHGKDIVAKLKKLKVPKVPPAGKIEPKLPASNTPSTTTRSLPPPQ